MRRRVIEVNVHEKSIVPRPSWLAGAYLWACERLYAELAWAYDWVSWLVSAGQWRRWQATIWRHVNGGDVLELGCGTGAMLVAGAARGYQLVGADRSSRMLALAQKRCLPRRDRCLLVQGDGRSLSLADKSFDCVVATFPSGYILDERTLAEIHRVLRERGRLVIAGLWVEMHLGAIGRWVPVFYGRPSAERLDAITQRVRSVGFTVQWIAQREGLFTVGVLVASREL